MSIRNLTEEREFRVYTPDVDPKTVQKNQPYLLKIVLPEHYTFLEVFQIEHPLSNVAGLGGLSGRFPKTMAYSFLVDPRSERQEPVYITTVFGDVKMPWPSSVQKDGDLSCKYLGCTTHNGVPIFHVQTIVESAEVALVQRLAPDPRRNEKFEAEVVEMGYRIVPGKTYELSKRLLNLYKADKSDEVVPEAAPPSQSAPERPASEE